MTPPTFDPTFPASAGSPGRRLAPGAPIPDPPAGFPATDRYEPLQRLGTGGMGVVFAARDRQTGRRVALKTLRWPEGEGVRKLKHEFRALTDLSHPNLVRLHDLHAADGAAWFTMEWVDGRGFVEHVRGPLRQRAGGAAPGAPLAPTETDGLRGLIRQLVEGIDALHAAGRLHRDIKPPNVLVTREGRVVLLDFGLATRLGPASPDAEESTRRQVVGTIAYMAPEQGWGAEVGPAADWYALGVMLYEALTGRRPFEATALMQVLLAKQAGEHPPPSAVAPGTPADLDALVCALLDPDPARRPAAAEILRRIGVPTTGLRSAGAPGGPGAGLPFVGRDDELALLGARLAEVAPGRPALVHVHGESGIGKTALLEHFLEQARPGLAGLLRSRCHPREEVAFKALDGIVDALSHRLTDLDPARRRPLVADLPPDLARLFPVLEGVPGLALPDASRPPADPAASLVAGLQALRDLLGRLADGAPLVLWVDDLQWGDLDSARGLRALLRGADAPPLLVLLTWPTADADSPPVARLRGAASPLPERTTELALGPLPPADAAALGRALLADPTADVDALVAVSQGAPFAAIELARHLRAHPDDTIPDLGAALAERIEALPGPERRLLEVVAVAGHPLSPAVAAVAALLDEPDAASQALVAAHLLRRTPRGRLDAYHRQIRATVRDGIDEDAARGIHARIARALQVAGEPASPVDHAARAGLSEAAAELALEAAEKARAALAFHLSAALLHRALALLPADHPERWQILDRLAEARARGGRSAEAGRTWSEAAELLARQEPGHARLRDLRGRAAEQLLRGGRLEDGLVHLDAGLRDEGLRLPASPGAAMRSLIWARLRLRVRGLGHRTRDASGIRPEALRRVDTCWTAAMGLCWVDSVQSAVFQCRYALLALATGEPDRVTRALATEAAFSASEGGAANRRRSAAALQTARETLGSVDDPVTHAIVDICDCAAAFFSARFSDAVAAAARAEARLAGAGQGWTWEALNAHVFGLWSATYRGDLDALAARLPALLDAAHDRGDLLTAASLGSGAMGLVWLAQDRPEVARQRADDAMALWVHDQGFHTQHYMNLVARTQLDLYAGDGVAAWQRMAEALPRMKRAMMLRLQYMRMESTWTRGRAALAAVAQGPAALARAGLDRDRLLAQVRADAGALAAEDLPWGAAQAAGLRAGLAGLTRSPDHLDRLREAVAAFDAADMALCRECARHRLGQALPDAAAAAPRAEAAAWMAARGVVRPDHLAAIFVPG